MATSGNQGDGQQKPDKYKDNAESLLKWPLEYVDETKECACGWCGQTFMSSHTVEDLSIHFKTCKNTKENGRSMIFKELRKVDQKIKGLHADALTKIDNLKTEFDNAILDIKSDVTKYSEAKGGEASDGARSTFFVGVKVLKEEMMKKMAEVSGTVTETVSSFFRSVLKAKSISSADTNEPNQSKNKTEALRGDIHTMKRGSETVSEQSETDLQGVKRQLDNETAKQLPKKKKKEPFPLDSFTMPLSCFNLAAHNSHFRPSFRWTVGGIKAIIAQKTFELSSQLFQWNGYPVRARAKFQLKEDDKVYLSLRMNRLSKNEMERKDFTPVPKVFYLLKGRNAKDPRHLCRSQSYLSSCTFKSSLAFDVFFAHKSWLNHSSYNLNDSVEVEIYVEPSPMAQLVHSYDGTLEWNIDKYARKLQWAKDGLVSYQESPYFYTSERGYRVQVEISLNGERGPSAYVLFWAGQFDAELPESFPHSTTFTLINPKNPEVSIRKTIVRDIKNGKYYDLEICKVEEVDQLVENDTLFCKVVVRSH